MYGFQYLRIWAVHRARTQQHLNTGDNERRTKVLSWHTSENACCRNPNSLLMNSFPSIVSTSHSSLTLKLSRPFWRVYANYQCTSTEGFIQ